ncbi:MAG: SpoIIE family protein phosphatase [Bryobacteraceae bacterium]|nr:SpoIIE family protein phosphatase [Bryobacteraceae bacterium]
MNPTPAATPSFQEPALLVTNPSGNRTRLKITPLPFTIGRQAGNHLVLRDNRASRNHARITLDNGAYYVEDLNSRNGVTVNGVKVSGRMPLASGDEIEFGVENSYRLTFSLEESELLKLMGQLSLPGKGAVPENLGKLRALVEVARTVQSALSADYVLSAVVDAALTVTGAQRGFLLLRRNGVSEVAVARDWQGASLEPGALPVAIPVIEEALERNGQLVVLPGGYTCVPLFQVRSAATEETIAMSLKHISVGALCLESGSGLVSLSAGDRQLLETLAVEASTILENARLLEQERLRTKMEEELSIARQIQRSLMPRSLPTEGWFRAAVANIPSHKVGGDYCDVSHLGAGAWGFVIADVSGKGVSSALLASLLQGAFLGGGLAATKLEDLMRQVNVFLTERTQGEKYVTMFGGVIQRDGAMRWTNAGHCPALLIRASGAIEMLEPTSMPLGMLEEAEFEVRDALLQPGDRILAYTDGVSEAQNRLRRFFGTARIERTVRAHRDSSCQAMLAALIQAVDDFNDGTEQEDDMTAVAMQYAGQP